MILLIRRDNLSCLGGPMLAELGLRVRLLNLRELRAFLLFSIQF